MKLRIIFAAIIVLFGLGIFVLKNLPDSKQPKMDSSDAEGKIKYISLGDSYTIGNGVPESGRWPNVLTQHLNEAGINIRLIANPAVSGYTVEDAVRTELPVVKKLQPDFVTVLIGANDNFRQKDVDIFQKDFVGFLDELQAITPNPENIVLITIPDYGKSPAVAGEDTELISKSIEEYNEVIKSEANKRGLKVADIFPVSQTMTSADDYIDDGLHPSAQGYTKWEKVIYPVVYSLLK